MAWFAPWSLSLTTYPKWGDPSSGVFCLAGDEGELVEFEVFEKSRVDMWKVFVDFDAKYQGAHGSDRK